MYKLTPPDAPMRGDLLVRTTSYPEIMEGCRLWLKDQIVKQISSQILKALHVDGEAGIPDDVEANADEMLQWMLMVYLPIMVPLTPRLKKVQAVGKRFVDGRVKAFLHGRLNAVVSEVRPLLLTSRATGHPLDRNLRIVRKSPHLVFEEVKRYYTWEGTLIDAMTGNLLSPCDPSRDFILYLPKQKVPLRVKDTWIMHITQQNHR